MSKESFHIGQEVGRSDKILADRAEVSARMRDTGVDAIDTSVAPAKILTDSFDMRYKSDTMRNVDRVSLLMSDALDRARRERRMTQAALADRMGRASAGSVSLLLDGRTARTSTYARALDALDLELVIALRPRSTAPGPQRPQ